MGVTVLLRPTQQSEDVASQPNRIVLSSLASAIAAGMGACDERLAIGEDSCMFRQFVSSRPYTPARFQSVRPYTAIGVIFLLVVVLLATCGRSTVATPPTNPGAHGLYVTSIQTPAKPESSADTVTITSLGLADGRLGWQASSSWIPFVSQLHATVVGSLLLTPVLTIPAMQTASPTSSLVAADRQTGRRLWSVSADALISAVAISDEVVYVSGLQSTPSHAYQKVVTALRASDGHKLWRLVAPEVNGFNDVITPVGGVLSIVSNQICFDSCSAAYLFAVRMSDGRLLWEHTLAGNFNLAAPTIDHGMLYLNVPVDDPVSGASFELDVYHADTGALAWRFAPRVSQFGGYSAPYVAEGTVYSGATMPLVNDHYRPDHWAYTLVALDGQTGAQKWQITTELYPAIRAANAQILLVADQTAIQPSGNVGVSYLSAIRRSDGKRLWRVEQTQYLVSPQFVGNAIVGILSQPGPGQRGEAVAFSAADGQTLWRTSLGVTSAQPTTAQPITNSSAPLVILGAVIYATYDGATVYALRLGDGGVLWKTRLPTAIMGLTVV